MLYATPWLEVCSTHIHCTGIRRITSVVPGKLRDAYCAIYSWSDSHGWSTATDNQRRTGNKQVHVWHDNQPHVVDRHTLNSEKKHAERRRRRHLTLLYTLTHVITLRQCDTLPIIQQTVTKAGHIIDGNYVVVNELDIWLTVILVQLQNKENSVAVFVQHKTAPVTGSEEAYLLWTKLLEMGTWPLISICTVHPSLQCSAHRRNGNNITTELPGSLYPCAVACKVREQQAVNRLVGTETPLYIQHQYLIIWRMGTVCTQVHANPAPTLLYNTKRNKLPNKDQCINYNIISCVHDMYKRLIIKAWPAEQRRNSI